jgi:hypothetical protein
MLDWIYGSIAGSGKYTYEMWIMDEEKSNAGEQMLKIRTAFISGIN